jgi:hypothetical protein
VHLRQASFQGSPRREETRPVNRLPEPLELAVAALAKDDGGGARGEASAPVLWPAFAEEDAGLAEATAERAEATAADYAAATAEVAEAGGVGIAEGRARGAEEGEQWSTQKDTGPSPPG